MKDILWIKILFAIIQYFRATLLLLTVITGKKQAFWNSNDIQRASFAGKTPLLLAIYQIRCKWESNFCKMKNSQIHWLHCTPCWFSSRFEDGFPNIHSQPRLVAGLIMAAWNSFKGGNVSLATGKMLKAPRQGSCCYSISIFRNIPRKTFSLPAIF